MTEVLTAELFATRLGNAIDHQFSESEQTLPLQLILDSLDIFQLSLAAEEIGLQLGPSETVGLRSLQELYVAYIRNTVGTDL